jgi:Tol biopolymer transport system component
MQTTTYLAIRAFPVLLLALGCGPDTGMIEPATRSDGVEASRASKRYSEWSSPVNLGPVINSSGLENGPELSRDGLSLYFSSARAGGLGMTDIYVSRRDCMDMINPLCVWKAPVNLGATVNSNNIDGGPNISRDGRELLLISGRLGGFGSNDIYVSRRACTDTDNPDCAWSEPANLGAPVNTSQLEAGPNPWGKEFYFHRGPAVGNTEIFVSQVRSGTFGQPSLVRELSSGPELSNGFFTQRPSVSSDGREIFFSSNRPGSLPETENSHDIWSSTRQSKHHVWTTPVQLASPINTGFNEQTPMISDDGTMLFFTSNRLGGSGDLDLYVATRRVKPDKQHDENEED